MRAADNVIAEIRQLKAMGFPAIMFYDDEFNINHKRTMEVVEAIKGENIKWRCFIKANLFNEEQAKVFAAAGCWETCTGVESGSDAILKAIKKKSTVADNTRARQLCKKYGIRFKAFAMIGHAGETEETADATRRWLLENKPDEFDLSVYTPYLGTPVVEKPELFDIKFNLHYDKEEFFYKGKPGEYQANASTSKLSAQRITQLRDSISAEVRDALGLAPLAPPALVTARPADTITQECR